jgi:hypothetical protein
LSKEVHILEFQKRTSEHDFQKGTIFFSKEMNITKIGIM